MTKNNDRRASTGSESAPVLIVGGYGVVGLQLAKLVRRRAREIPLLIAGRNQVAADRAAVALGNAKGVVLDVTSDDPLLNISTPLRAVVAATNDPHNALLRATIARHIPYVDITRWTEHLMAARQIAKQLQPQSSVTFASSWMAGLSAIVARQACEGISKVKTIDTTILFRLNDKAGPNSVEYADRLLIPFRVRREGRWEMVKPLTDPVRAVFPGGVAAKAYRFDEPSQETLFDLTGARSISSRIAYDNKWATRTLVFLVRSGLWALINRPAFKTLRHSLLYNPGDGASHEINIRIAGEGADRHASISDPKGQTHLTAVGAYIQLCEAVGLENQPSRPAGVHFPEHETNYGFARNVLEQEDVRITI